MSVRNLRRRMSTTLQLDASTKVEANRHVNSLTLEPLEDLVTCPIHLNFLVDPRLLPCGHAFCCNCLTDYMSKLKVTSCVGIGNEGEGGGVGSGAGTFACPICRSACSLPADRRGESLQTAFNHTAILDFIRNTRLAGLESMSGPKECVNGTGATANRLREPPPPYYEEAPTTARQHDNGAVPFPKSRCSTTTTTTTTAAGNNNGGGRKTSMQVSSQMLDLIVQDIATRQRDGRVSGADRSAILDTVNRLVSQLQTGEEGTEKVRPSSIDSQLARKQSSAVSSISPSSSTRNLGRFHRFAARIRSPPLLSRRPQGNSCQLEQQNHQSTEEVGRSRTMMKQNACYRIIAKEREEDLVQSNFEFQPIDGHYSLSDSSSQTSNSSMLLDRVFLTVDKSQTKLVLRRQLVSSSIPGIRRKSTKHLEVKQSQRTFTVPLNFPENARVQVQYLRIVGEYIYLTAVTYNQHILENIETTGFVSDRQTLADESGFLIRCSTKQFQKAVPGEAHAQGQTSFPIDSVSCFFKRDEVGLSSGQHPLVFGLDVDRHSGDVFVSQPANGMVCRLRGDRLDQVDASWYFNDNQLSPYFLCYASNTNSVWATCPRDGKIVVLDLVTSGLFQFAPSVCFGITPSHIVYTTDHRVVVLDKRQSSLYWISRVDQTICFQSIQVMTACDLPQQLTVIQPAADVVLAGAGRQAKTLTGGVFCLGERDCLLVYPERQLNRGKNAFKLCFR